MNVESQPNMKLVWTGRVISTFVVLPLLLGAIMMARSSAEVSTGMAHLGIPVAMITTLIILKLLSVVLYAIPATSITGAIVLTGYMGGAILTHLRIGEPVIIQTLLPLLAWLGLYLREPRLWALLPLRR